MKEFDEGAQALNRVTHCGPIAIIFYLRLWSRRAAWVHVSQACDVQRRRWNGPVGKRKYCRDSTRRFYFCRRTA
jgi:hypothetical protein